MGGDDELSVPIDPQADRTDSRSPSGSGISAVSHRRFAAEAVQAPARVNVTCVTPLGEEMASTS
jgi:hypothetical protein